MAITYERGLAFVQGFAAAIAENKEYLTELDSAIGDADHGINMDRGMQAVLPKLGAREGADLGPAVQDDRHDPDLDRRRSQWTSVRHPFPAAGHHRCGPDRAVGRGLEPGPGGRRAGGAGPGQGRARGQDHDRRPAAGRRRAARRRPGRGLARGGAAPHASAAAEQGMLATIPLVARKGRASYLGERSAGHQDPGATSSWLLVRAARQAFTSRYVSREARRTHMANTSGRWTREPPAPAS